jgi:MarR family transcriptional regulator, transcriptional regulator for hemolysin
VLSYDTVSSLIIWGFPVLKYDFEQSIACWVCRTARAFELALNDELEPLGITYRQWQALGWLAFEGELTQNQLAERMKIEAPTLVGILDRMERDGWIVRAPAKSDRRKKIIRPTPRVQPVWSKITAAARRVRQRALRGVPVKDVERTIGLLEKVLDNLQGTAMPRENAG